MKFIITLILMSPFYGWARGPVLDGPISSGGGMAVSCNINGEKTVQLLDYYEAVDMYGKENVAQASGDILEDYSRLIKRTHKLQGYDGGLVVDPQEDLDNFFGAAEWVEPGELPFLNDHGKTVDIPAGCSIEQLAIFYDSREKIKIVKSLWNQMDSMNKAALIEHEFFYIWERMNMELNSMSTRAYVRQMLTAEVQVPVNQGATSADMFCRSRNKNSGVAQFAMYVYKNESGSTLQFTMFAKSPLLTLTTVETSADFDLIRKVDPDFGPIVKPADPAVNISETYKAVTDHRDDWELKLNFKGGSPVTIQALKSGVPISDSMSLSCSTF